MARLILLMAKRPFRHHGKQMTTGEVFQASAIDAVALTYHGQAVLAPAKKVAAPLPVAKTIAPIMGGIPVNPLPIEPIPPVEPIGTDGGPQDADHFGHKGEEGPAGEPDPIEAEEPKPKRRYKRRDLEAEDSHEPV